MDTIKRWLNWLRMQWHVRVTGRAQRIEIKDTEGKTHEVTVERDMEKVCDHKTLKEIATTMWKCATPGCDTFFQINYKVQLTERDLLTYLSQIADALKVPDPLEEPQINA